MSSEQFQTQFTPSLLIFEFLAPTRVPSGMVLRQNMLFKFLVLINRLKIQDTHLSLLNKLPNLPSPSMNYNKQAKSRRMIADLIKKPLKTENSPKAAFQGSLQNFQQSQQSKKLSSRGYDKTNISSINSGIKINFRNSNNRVNQQFFNTNSNSYATSINNTKRINVAIGTYTAEPQQQLIKNQRSGLIKSVVKVNSKAQHQSSTSVAWPQGKGMDGPFVNSNYVVGNVYRTGNNRRQFVNQSQTSRGSMAENNIIEQKSGIVLPDLVFVGKNNSVSHNGMILSSKKEPSKRPQRNQYQNQYHSNDIQVRTKAYSSLHTSFEINGNSMKDKAQVLQTESDQFDKKNKKNANTFANILSTEKGNKLVNFSYSNKQSQIVTTRQTSQKQSPLNLNIKLHQDASGKQGRNTKQASYQSQQQRSISVISSLPDDGIIGLKGVTSSINQMYPEYKNHVTNKSLDKVQRVSDANKRKYRYSQLDQNTPRIIEESPQKAEIQPRSKTQMTNQSSDVYKPQIEFKKKRSPFKIQPVSTNQLKQSQKQKSYSLYLNSAASGGGCITHSSSAASLKDNTISSLKHLQVASKYKKPTQQVLEILSVRSKSQIQQSSSPASGIGFKKPEITNRPLVKSKQKGQNSHQFSTSELKSLQSLPSIDAYAQKQYMESSRIQETADKQVVEEIKNDTDPSNQHTERTPNLIRNKGLNQNENEVLPKQIVKQKIKPDIVSSAYSSIEPQQTNVRSRQNSMTKVLLSNNNSTVELNDKPADVITNSSFSQGSTNRQQRRHNSQSVSDAMIPPVVQINTVNHFEINFPADSQSITPKERPQLAGIKIEVSRETLNQPLSKDYTDDMTLLMYDFNNSSQRELGKRNSQLSDLVIREENTSDKIKDGTPPRQIKLKRNSTPFNQPVKVTKKRVPSESGSSNYSYSQKSYGNNKYFVQSKNNLDLFCVNQKVDKAKQEINLVTNGYTDGTTAFQMKSPTFLKVADSGKKSSKKKDSMHSSEGVHSPAFGGASSVSFNDI